jgi:hypothetical protein
VFYFSPDGHDSVTHDPDAHDSVAHASVLDEGGIFYYSADNVYVGRSAFYRMVVGILVNK